MNKRILFSSLSILASAAIVTGATFAFFSDSETSAGNTFTAGKLDLKVNGQDNPGTLVTLTAKPSEDKDPITVTLHNDGSNGGIADLHFTGIVDNDNGKTEPECTAEQGGWISPSGPCASPSPVLVKSDVSTKIGVDIGYDLNGNGTVEESEYLIWHDNNTNQAIDSGDTFEWGDNTNPNNVVATLAQLNSKSFDLGYLMGGTERKLVLSFHLDGTTGNEYQTDQTTFNIEFTLHQVNASPNPNIVPSGIPTPPP